MKSRQKSWVSNPHSQFWAVSTSVIYHAILGIKDPRMFFWETEDSIALACNVCIDTVKVNGDG